MRIDILSRVCEHVSRMTTPGACNQQKEDNAMRTRTKTEKKTSVIRHFDHFTLTTRLSIADELDMDEHYYCRAQSDQHNSTCHSMHFRLITGALPLPRPNVNGNTLSLSALRHVRMIPTDWLEHCDQHSIRVISFLCFIVLSIIMCVWSNNKICFEKKKEDTEKQPHTHTSSNV